MSKPKVYWAARNLGAWWNPFGNHHFVLIRDVKPILTLSPVRYKEESFMTLGGFKVNGFLVFEANNASDVQSVKEKIDSPASWTDLQRHRVASPYGVDQWFAEGLVVRALNYERNSKAAPLPFNLFGENCAAWVNTLLKSFGVPEEERRHAGQFWGIDAGEQLEIPEEMFKKRESYIPEPPPLETPGNGNGRRIHVVKRGDWLSKIAQAYYGDMNKWKVIYDHPDNRRKIGPNPDLIEVGQELVIP